MADLGCPVYRLSDLWESLDLLLLLTLLARHIARQDRGARGLPCSKYRSDARRGCREMFFFILFSGIIFPL